MMAASKPMMASTHRISISAKPRWPECSARAAGNVGCRSTAALLTVGPERDDFVGRALARRMIDIAVSPGIVGHHAAPDIGPVPPRPVVPPRQSLKPFAAVRLPPQVTII